MVKFLLAVFALAFALAAIMWFLAEQGWIVSRPSFFYPTLIFLAFATSIIYLYLYRVKKAAAFVQLFLLLTVIKLIAALGFSLLIVLKDRPQAKMNILFFIIIYMAYTGLEVAFLYRQTRTEKRP